MRLTQVTLWPRYCETLTGPSSCVYSHPAFWKHIWGTSLPQKINHFLWSLCNNAIAVKSNLLRRNMTQDPTCPICHKEEETIVHTFMHCDWTRPVWFGSTLQIDPTSGMTQSMFSRLSMMISQFGPDRDHSSHALSCLEFLLWGI